MKLTDREFDFLEYVMQGDHQSAEVSYLDLVVLNDVSIRSAVDGGKGHELLATLDRILDLVPDEDQLSALLDVPFKFTWAPEGHDGRQWLVAMRERVVEVLTDPTIVPLRPFDDGTAFKPPRAARWSGPDPTEEALARLGPALDAWMTEPTDDTCFRQHHLVDLGRVIGQVTPVIHRGRVAEVQWHKSVPTTTVSVGVTRNVKRTRSQRDEYDLHTWQVVYSRPELPLDPAVRQRFPDLCHLFGGYYGQPFDDEHGWPIWMTAQAMNRTSGTARDRMRDQLAELLTIESDDDLIAAVGHLGSYCLPAFMRHWVDRLHWKIDALDWGPPVLPRDDSPPLPT